MSFVEASRSQTTGVPTRDTSDIIGATALAMPSGLRSAKFFGTSSPTTTDR
jgi:hypothetical protein